MKFDFSYKYFFIGLLIVLVINYDTFLTSNNQDTQITATISGTSSNLTVESGDIKESIEVVGEAQLVDEQSLNFNKVGTVTLVNFKAGDQVLKGETIAEIDNTDAYNSIEEAKINLENAQISLKQLYDPVDESQILQSQNSVTQAENNLSIATQELANLKVTQQNNLDKMLEDIETSKKELSNLIKEKENSLSDTESNKSKTVQNIEDSFKSNLVDIDRVIEESDYIMGVTDENRDKNDSFEDYLGAKDTNLKYDAKASLLETISLYNNLKESFSKYDYSGDREKLISLLGEYLALYEKLYTTTDLIYRTVDASITSVGSLSDSEISSMKNTMSSYRSSSLSKVSSIKSDINTLNTLTDPELLSDSNELTIEKQTLSVANSIKSYDETVASYKVTLESKQKDLENKKISLELAKLNYEELLEGPTDDNVRKAQNSIKQAQIKLDNAYKDLEDYMIIAPFDGVIRKIDYMPGDNLTNDTDKYIYIENPDLLEITVMLDQIDITGVELGDDAIITFDAYQTTPVNAKVSSIDTTPIASSGVVSYEVKLVLDDETFDKKVLSGFTADVEIITKSKEDILLLKTSAITEKDGEYYVNVIKDGEVVETKVEIGIASDGMTEIIFGLEEGDSISVKEFLSSSSEEDSSSTSLFGPTGNRDSSSGDFAPPGGF